MMATRKKIKRPEFRFGKRLREGAGHHAPDNLPGTTVGETSDGRPRPLDFRHYDAVDFSMNDVAEDYS